MNKLSSCDLVVFLRHYISKNEEFLINKSKTAY